MAKYQRKTNYREKYPGVSREIIEALERSDRQMEYLQYDIKVERCRIDSVSGITKFIIYYDVAGSVSDAKISGEQP